MHVTCTMALCSLLGLRCSPNLDVILHDVQFLGGDVMNSSQARQQRINEVVSTYQRHPGDSGSSEVQGTLQIFLQTTTSVSFDSGCANFEG